MFGLAFNFSTLDVRKEESRAKQESSEFLVDQQPQSAYNLL
jgi:hypothetical protein